MKKLSVAVMATMIFGVAGCSNEDLREENLPVPEAPATIVSPPPVTPEQETEPVEPEQETEPVDLERAAAYQSEYKANWSFEAIGVDKLHERGGTGEGITIGIVDVDSSPNHVELEGKYEKREGSQNVWSRRPHGGPVGAIMVAKRDGIGMHGVAYDANLAAYAIPRKRSTIGLGWLNQHRIFLANSSVGGNLSRTDVAYLTIARYYVRKGGVIVYATGNDSWGRPEDTAGAPRFDASLERGWLAVADVKRDGTITKHTNRCGYAASWCLVAPGIDILTIDGRSTDRYRTVYGTSYAAPLVTGGIGALKSLFPSLSYQELRARILHTANKTGHYADSTIYGQGLLDLDAASAPVGGTYFPTGSTTRDRAQSTANAQAVVGRSFAQTLRGKTVLVIDGYQRAPFRIKLDQFISERQGWLRPEELQMEVPRHLEEVEGERKNMVWCHGAKCEETMDDDTYMFTADTLGVRMRPVAGQGRIELSGRLTETGERPSPGSGVRMWAPTGVATVSFIGEKDTSRVAFSVASGLAHPGGMASEGAFAIAGQAIGAGYKREVRFGDRIWGSSQARITYLDRESEHEVVTSANAWVAGWASELTMQIAQQTWVSGQIELEYALGGSNTMLQAATSVNENGALGYRGIALDDGSLNNAARAVAKLVHRIDRRSTIGGGIALAGDGAGNADAIAGIQYKRAL